MTARKMMGDDQKLIQIRTHTRFIAFPRHRHDFIEMMYVCKGSCTHIIDGQEITVTGGNETSQPRTLLPDGSYHVADYYESFGSANKPT